jgi:hypothetical protein
LHSCGFFFWIGTYTGQKNVIRSCITNNQQGEYEAPMATPGACNDTQDLDAFKTTNSTFHGLLQSCAEKCLGMLFYVYALFYEFSLLM